MKRRAIRFGALLAISWALASVAQAQLPRTYISSAGDDNNTCVLTAPCRTFSGAASKTATQGEITALDTALYGNIFITKALTLQALAHVQAVMGNGGIVAPIIIGTPETDVVVLRKLYITRSGSWAATQGIRLQGAGAVHIEDCIVSGFSEDGIYSVPSGGINNDGRGPRLFLKDTLVRDNGVGVHISNAFVSIDRTRMENNDTGILIESRSTVTIRDSVMAGNTSYGLKAATATVKAVVENCVVTTNGTGIHAETPAFGSVKVFVSHTMISNNGTGLSGNGTITSFRNNRLAGNTTNGAFTSTIAEQ